MDIVLNGEELSLLPEKAIYWPKKNLLLIADVHLGKVEHFRKAGLAVPAEAGEANYHVLQELILEHNPERIIFLGDLFHSDYNYDWELFTDFLESHNHVSFELIMGNHDILHRSQYDRTGMILHREQLIIESFLLTHDPVEHGEYYNLCGHIHPCYKMRGKSRQYLRLPCFYFGLQGGILPALGSFTGMHPVTIQDGDHVYVIADDQIIQVE
jgi:DNA ligase-associated metallophosphoesterase